MLSPCLEKQFLNEVVSLRGSVVKTGYYFKSYNRCSWKFRSGNYVIKTTDRDLAMGAVLCCCCLLVAKSFQALETPWAVTHQVPLSMGLSRQGYWCE